MGDPFMHDSTSEEVSEMKGSLAAEQAELLRGIEQLEMAVARLHDVNAEVSIELNEKLRRLRELVLNAKSPSKWRTIGDVLLSDIAVRVAVELLKKIVETSICLITARRARRWINAGWRVHQITALRCGTLAA
jgi:hypothetical protein